MTEAIDHPDTDVVVIALPNHLHEEAVAAAARAGKAILCTKPLGRTAAEAKRMLEAVEKAGVFAGYLEDLCYTPKTLKSIESVRAGAVGDVLWVRSREAHPGPHSAWFWDEKQAGGGCIVDLGCHCIEIIRNFVGKGNRPVEVLCWKDTLVHPISAEDNAIALIRFESGAMGQFEVSWTFRGGMDLRDEVAGTRGTIWLNHFLRTGFEMFTASAADGYIAEKAETTSGWLFPVGDEAAELGYVDMFTDMFNAMEAHARDVRRQRGHQTRDASRRPREVDSEGSSDRGVQRSRDLNRHKLWTGTSIGVGIDRDHRVSLCEAAGGRPDQASAVGGPAELHVMREEGLAGRAHNNVALPAGRGWTELIWKLPATRDWCRARAIVAAKLGISAAARGKGYER